MTSMSRTKNLSMSSTMRLSDTCSGPRCGFTLKMYTSLSELKMLAAENSPSESSMGSHASHCSRGWFHCSPRACSRRTCKHTRQYRSLPARSHLPRSPRPAPAPAYLEVGHDAQRHGGHIQRVGHEVDHVPHVMNVLPETHVPQLFHLTPYQTCTDINIPLLSCGSKRMTHRVIRQKEILTADPGQDEPLHE